MARKLAAENHVCMMGALLAALLTTTAPCSLQAQPAPSTTAPTGERLTNLPPTLTVTGDGETSTSPDRAVVELGAVAQAEQASTAQEQVNAIMQAAIGAIREAGIGDKMISTAGISLNPVYTDRQPIPLDRKSPPDPRITGYRAGNRVRVVIDDLKKVGDVIDAGVKAGANQVENLSFQLKDDTAARREALTEAAGKARAKADALASAMDLQIEGVLAVNEGGTDVFRPRMELAVAGMAARNSSTPVQPGQVDVQASVTITYRVSPAASGAKK